MKKKLPLAIFMGVIGFIASMYYLATLDSMLREVHITSYNVLCIIKYLILSPKATSLFGICLLLGVFVGGITLTWNPQGYKSRQYQVTNKISIPMPAGEGQCGTAWWLSKSDFKSAFEHYTLELSVFEEWMKHNLDDIKGIKSSKSYLSEISIENGGIVLGKMDEKKQETIFFNGEDSHVQIIGATRSGKGRTVVLQSICTLALARESLIITDPKGELYGYTSFFLKNLDYDIITIDFKNPRKSTHYNYLQSIIDSVSKNDIPSATDHTWDLTSILVGEPIV